MSHSSLADLRQNYVRSGLLESDIFDDPMDQFQRWFDDAVDADLLEPNAMTLSTVAETGKPSSRIVLLKGIDPQGFVFYTNYNSRKGQDLTVHPWASLVFVWLPLERQVRVEGAVEKVSRVETEAYFQTRPRGSQIGAWVSSQSEVICGRQVLEDELTYLTAEYENQAMIPCPPHWGGFRVKPTRIEFWQGRPNRLHDRLCYCRQPDQSWRVMRLAP
jgi:pyridoxamine 5'-phosphate oxidase